MINKFLNQLHSEGKADSTVMEYRFRLNKFMTYLDKNDMDYHDIKTPDLIDFRQYMLDEGLSSRRSNNIFSTLHCFYDFLMLYNEVTVNPVAKGLHMPTKNKRIERLSDEDIRQFRAYIDQLHPNVRCAFLLMLTTGARVGEVANLKKSDFIIKNDQLYVSITNAKWQSDREVPILDTNIANILWPYLIDLDINSLPAFRTSKRTLQRHMSNFSKDTGIDCCCHLLRHTFAAKLLEQNIPMEVIKTLLGHKTLNMTAYYTQSARVDLTRITADMWSV